MIKFNDLSQEKPYLKFKQKYDDALSANQKNIEAVSISSYSKSLKEVNSRFVNLKFIKDKEFIFFSNYKSPKSIDFQSHDQIASLIYWSSINVQIRLKAHVKKTTKEFNHDYFAKRDKNKNALAISSCQSSKVESYEIVKKNYRNALENENLHKCPGHWGGYSFEPYYFEFWEGHKSRLNKREAYEKNGDSWKHFILQP
jgi:pyridoxamine 5'-phosphate oxidase